MRNLSTYAARGFERENKYCDVILLKRYDL